MLSVVNSKSEISRFVAALEDALAEIRPVLEQEASMLLRL
jgi:hypothetical protein